MRTTKLAIVLLASFVLSLVGTKAQAQTSNASDKQRTVAQQWTDTILFAIRLDLARPTVHARNLYHLSAAMYDAWTLYDEWAITTFINSPGAPAACQLNPEEKPKIRNGANDVQKAREQAVGYAAWAILNERFKNTSQSEIIFRRIAHTAQLQGLTENSAEFASMYSPAATGVRVANCVLAMASLDNSNELNNFDNLNYQPVNSPLDPTKPGNPNVLNPNRWQPLQLETFIDQSGNITDMPTFLGADWGNVHPFSLTETDKSYVRSDDGDVLVWLDPGPPVWLTNTASENQTYQKGNALVVLWSSQLDPSNGTLIDISPANIGNLGSLSLLPSDHAGALQEYDSVNGGLKRAKGHALNPATGKPYVSNKVPMGDYTRVVAEFWADGTDSETPPGHWFALYNDAVVSHPLHSTQVGGIGELLDPLAYDVLAYLALGGAMHDSAIAAWSVKRAYDYVRPISAIRYMASLGQSTNPDASNFHVKGIPLVPNFIETVTKGDALAGKNAENVGKIKARAWRGPDYIDDRFIDVAGVGWILLENWWPYQRPTFVTPPFAGYVSGHSTFSRAAAEVLTALTGDPFFPGGMAEFVARQNQYLVFEKGPSVDVKLQWATYRDAADQTSLSRIWGGIHPPVDDIAGRRMGELIGAKAWAKALSLKEGIEPTSDAPQKEVISEEIASAGLGCSISRHAQSDLPVLVFLLLVFLYLKKWPRKVSLTASK